MKKIIALLLAAVLLLSLAACGAAAQPATTQGEHAPAGETNAATQAAAPADPNKVVLGRWEVKMRTPDGETAQYLQFNEDGTGAYELYEADADGVLQQTNAYDFEWAFEEGLYVCTSEKYTDYYFYTAGDNTLTDDHQHGRVFKPAA